MDVYGSGFSTSRGPFASSKTAGASSVMIPRHDDSVPFWLRIENAPANKNGHCAMLLGDTQGKQSDFFAGDQQRGPLAEADSQRQPARVPLRRPPFGLKTNEVETPSSRVAGSQIGNPSRRRQLSAAQAYAFGRADFPAGGVPSSITTGDFNRDGILDFAISNSGSGTVSIFLGMPDGTFAPRVDYATGAGP